MIVRRDAQRTVRPRAIARRDGRSHNATDRAVRLQAIARRDAQRTVRPRAIARRDGRSRMRVAL